MNDTLIRTRTIARIKSERSGQGQTLARRHEDEERVWMDTQRAARLPHRHGHRDSYAQNGFASSPTPRVGEVMSPGMAFPARMGGGNSTPSRRPIPYHAFTAASGDSTLSGSTYSFPSSRGLSLKDEPAWLGIPSGASRETPVKEEKHRQWDTGPQTFAEMGFIDVCVVEVLV
ncbi:hypothetical protein BD324DRAFT_226098 [Kockovaella imperatae]|uniref:Uncharacterized protein n=1 Tax=Kockovaella imperatae TaxID=4999 RepID=A0A1Y1UNQ0_9TREE|nr:hypothetical protein BD324DRAFT_226098 [Kockovaella imperatae]ORX39668.1 hypothetical protein BD324DRAFT_226098 [Kockovaella imperatae]